MINSDLFTNILSKNLHEAQREALLNSFPTLNELNSNSYLFLYKYLSNIPEKFYSEKHFKMFLETLELFSSESDDYIELLNDSVKQIDISFLALADINNIEFHNQLLPTDKAELQLLCSQFYNPNYLHLIESVFSHVIKILAYISRKNRGSSVDVLDIYNCIEELNSSDLSCFTTSYRHTVRNGIGHGHIEYNYRDIVYTDKRNNYETLTYSELVDIYNDLLDICNASVLALNFFYLSHMKDLEIPQQMMLEILQAETNTPWWKVKRYLVSKREDDKKQLNIFVEANSIDFNKIQHSAYFTAILAEQLLPGYDYYFLSFSSQVAYPGFAMFIGERLENARKTAQPSFENYIDVLQDNLLFYAPKIKYPVLVKKVETFWYSGRIHIPMALNDYYKNMGHLKIDLRNIKLHRRSFYLILTGDIVINNLECLSQSEIKTIIKEQINKILKKAYRKERKSLFSIFLPLGYTKLNLFRKDYRVSKLNSFGLSEDLIGTVERNWYSKISIIDIWGSTIEIYKKFRFAWNKNWLDSYDI